MDIKGHRGSVAFDGRQVTISKRMRGQVTIPVGQVTAVEVSRAGFGMMAIRFAVAGAPSVQRQTALGSFTDALNDPYSLPFRTRRRDEFTRLRDAVNAAKV